MNPRTVYLDICEVRDPDEALAKLHDATLAALAKHILMSYQDSGFPGLVRGLVMEEIANRWIRENERQPGAVGEGSN